MASKKRWRWVVRDGTCVIVFDGKKKPARDKSTWWVNGGKGIVMEPYRFKGMFGFLPPIGRPVKVQFTAKVVP